MPGYDGIEMEGELTDVAGQQPGEGGTADPQQPVEGQPPGAQPQVGDQQTVEGQQQVWNGQEWALKYRGQPYIPKSRDDLKNLAQKGFAYEQGMSQFNKDRTALQQQLQDLQKRTKHYDEFDSLLKTNPALADKIATTIQEMQQQPGGQPQGANIQIYQDLMNRINSLEQTHTESLNMAADQKVAGSIQKLRADHPDHDWEFDDGVSGPLEKQVVAFAVEHGITNLEYAYRSMMWDHAGTNAKAAAMKAAAAKKQQETRAGVVKSGAPSGGAPQGGYKYGDSYKDLASKMAAELKT